MSSSLLSRPGVVLAVALGVCGSARGQWQVSYLSPNLFGSSVAYGVSGGQQVGRAWGAYGHAALWSGASQSIVNLQPPAYAGGYSIAYGVSGGQQVGWVQAFYWAPDPETPTRAALWGGTAESFVDLHPPAHPSSTSVAHGASGGQQVGWVNHVADELYARASLWNGTAESWVDLHPPYSPINPVYYRGSAALDVSDGQQVGYAWVAGEVEYPHASLWSGTKESFVDLHPGSGPGSSRAYGVSGGQQVGYVGNHAGLWSGTAQSWVDLHPDGSMGSLALDIDGAFQVGVVDQHAALWSGTADSWVDLHAFLTADYSVSSALGIEVSGSDIWIAGSARYAPTDLDQAVMWHGTVPEPSSLLAVGGMFALTVIRRTVRRTVRKEGVSREKNPHVLRV